MAEEKDKTEEKLRLVLQDFTKEELIELVLSQSRRLRELEAKTTKMEKEMEELRRASKRPTAPFRVSEEKKKPKKKRPGRKGGHKGNFRKCSGPIAEELEVRLEGCPGCGGEVSEVRPLEQIIEEIPPIQVHRTRVITYRGKCQKCGVVRSRHPMQMSEATGSAKVQLGLSVLERATRLQYEFGLSKRKVCRLLSDFFGLRITVGGLVQLSHRVAKKLQTVYNDLVRKVRESFVIHADETSWYVGEPSHWLWVFANDYLTLYEVADNRGRRVAEEILGKDFKGVLVSDCLSVYDDLCQHQQKCYAHHLRAISEAIEKKGGRSRGFLRLVQKLLLRALDLSKIRDALNPDQLGLLCENLEEKAKELLPLRKQFLKTDPSRFVLVFDADRCPFELDEVELSVAGRLARQRDHLFTFLQFEGVDATNNLAERRLRPAVISRKISCGNKTELGAQTWKILTSLIQTCKQTGDSFLQTISHQFSVR